MPYSGSTNPSSLPYTFKIPDATESAAGVMSAEDKRKLDSIPSGGGGEAVLEGNVTGPLDNTLIVRIQDVAVDLTGHSAGEALIFDPTNTKIIPSNNPAGSVMSVSASAPLASSGGPNPDISITPGTDVGQVISWTGTQWVAELITVSGITRPQAVLFVGSAVNAAVTPDGSAVAPYPDLQAASDWCLANGITSAVINAAPEVYPDWVAPGGLNLVVNGGLTPVSASIGNITLTGSSLVVLNGMSVTGSLVIDPPLISDQVVCIFQGSANIQCPITRAGAGQVIIASVGLIEPITGFVAVTFGGTIDIGDGICVIENADIQQSVTCGLFSSTSCRNPALITCSGTQAKFSNAERVGGFPYGAPVVDFTGAPGTVEFDAVSLVSFGLAGGQITNGTLSSPGFFVRYPLASSAIPVGTPVKFDSNTTVGVMGTTEADMLALAGYTITASSAVGERVLVVGVGGSIIGVFAGLTAGEAQYVCGGAIVAASGLAAYIAGAALGSWFRRIGTARSATTIVPDFGDPMQIGANQVLLTSPAAHGAATLGSLTNAYLPDPISKSVLIASTRVQTPKVESAAGSLVLNAGDAAGPVLMEVGAAVVQSLTNTTASFDVDVVPENAGKKLGTTAAPWASTSTGSVGTDEANQHAFPSGTGTLLDTNSALNPANLSTVVPINKGGTNSSAALNNNRALVSSGGAIIESNASTTSQVLVGGSPPAFGSVPSGALPFTLPLSIANGGTNSATGDLVATNQLTSPLLRSPAATNLSLNANQAGGSVILQSNGSTALTVGASSTQLGSAALFPLGDQTSNIGSAALRFANVFSPVVNAGATFLTYTSNITDGASAIAHKIFNTTALANATARLVQFGSNSVEKAAILASGGLIAPTAGTDATNQHAFPSGTGALIDANSTRLNPAPSGAGKMIYDTGAAYAALAAGTSSQVLVGGAAPAFGAVPAAAISSALASSIYTSNSTFSAAAQATLTGNNGFCVAVQGKYAYVSDLSGSVLSIADVSDPSAPAAIGAVTLAGQLRGLAVQGNYAYVCNNSGNLFYVVDVSNPAAPTSVGSVAITSPYGMCVSGKYAYVFSENGVSSTIKVVDLSAPTAPVVVGSAAVDNVTCLKIDINGKYLYTCSSSAQTISVYDISVPTVPVRVNTPLNVAIAAIAVQASGRYLYATDTTNKLVVVDVSNPTTPSLVTTLTLTGASGGLYLSGRYCFVMSSSNSVVRIVDVQTPGSPAQIVTFATGASASAIGVCVAGKYAYIAYSSNPDKLGIVDLGGIETSVVKAASMQAGRALITESLNVAGSVAINSGLSVGPSGLYCDGLMTSKALNLGDGAVTQGTSVSTAVTLNASSGVITTFSQSALAGATSTFTVNNTFCLSTSVPLVTIGNYAGTYGTNGFPLATVSSVSNGSFNITIVNTAPTNALSGALKLNFAIL